MGKVDTRLLSVLVVRKACAEEADVVRWFSDHAHVEVVDTLEDARQALGQEHFDIVVSNARDFLPLHCAQLTQQATAILETVSQGVTVVDPQGRLVWSNARMHEYPPEVREAVCRWSREIFASLKADATRRSSSPRERRFWMTTADKHHLEITATPVMDLDNRVTHVAAVVWDATRARRLQEHIDAIDRAGRELVRLDAEQIARLNPVGRLALLEQKIVRSTRELMHFDNFAIRVRDRRTGRLDLVLSAGMPPEAQNIDIYAEPEGNGISGYVAARGRSYICPDVRKDPRYVGGIANARSSLTVPLRVHDQIVGIFNVESDKPAAFGEDDRQFAEMFARHVAVALHILNLLDSERYTTTGKLASNVMAEITGPLNDILTETANLIEDFIGYDELRTRLGRISDNAVQIRDSIKQVTAPQPGVIGVASSRARPCDPVLSGRTILVVDDEEVIRETVRDVLASRGCRVLVADDGAPAIDLINENHFDLVLSDIKMPGASGYEVFAAAKDADAQCPVILMTGFGYDPNHSIIRARQEGLAAVLFKPFKVDQLLSEIRNALPAPASH
ncbi:MAG: response regulator [Phycisphaerales bacterium]|nr:MAG: response regulator [Phycisphaerales bacterium]